MTQMEANNININYELEGEGKTIVFIHGLSDSLNYWRILFNELKNSYQILIYDLRAHGLTDNDDSEITIDLYTEDLFQLLKGLKIEKAVFAGLSLGGNIGLNFAIKHPEMLEGLIVMSSFSEMNEELEEIFNDFEMGIDKGFEEFFDVILPYTLPEDVLEKNRETLEMVKHEAAKVANVEGIKAGIIAGKDFCITDKLNEIDVPAIIISGKDDDLTNLELQRKIHENIKDSDMIILENTKHNVLIGKNIGRILKIIGDFMLKIE